MSARTLDSTTLQERTHATMAEAKAAWKGTPGRWLRSSLPDGTPFLTRQDDEGEDFAMAWDEKDDAAIRAAFALGGRGE